MAVGRAIQEPVSVFIVDSDPAQSRNLAGFIADRALGRFSATVCATPAEALGVARNRSAAILIADLETIGGADRLKEIAGPMLALIATSARGSLNTAIAAVKAGAIDFLSKPIGAAALMEHLEAAVAAWPARRQDPPAAAEVARPQTDGAMDGFVGNSSAMQAVYDQIRRMAPSRAPVFITGESGTGKELAAEAVHAHSPRQNRPFIAINCSAIPRDLMESEIFGHVRGAFTGAAENRAGAAELADGGTLFLDEIAEMDLSLQAKLLRFIQSGTLRRVGGSELKDVDVRFVCATNRDPFAEIESGRFRADLFYRLHVLPIELPPLRERRDDILPMAEAFLRRFAREEGRNFTGFDATAEALLLAHDWPGNVRQLQNVIRRCVVLHDGGRITADMLPGANTGETAASVEHVVAAAGIQSFHSQERRIIEEALAASGGNVPRAAAALEISPATIYRKIKTWTKPVEP